MSQQLPQLLLKLNNSESLPLLKRIQRGIEKESLRISQDGSLAQTPHPKSLGSALTHRCITTDFSEALMEFVTPVYSDAHQALEKLDLIHRNVYAEIGEERLWCGSMPCLLEGNDQIPVAQYGSSNVAKMKTAYRIGLGHRYGRKMQTIAGIHYNFSLPDELWDHLQQELGNVQDRQTFITERYFSLIRNFRRYGWLLLYLFGASPALCECFLDHDNHQLERHSDGTLYLPYATSLRMGDLGYKSSAQSKLRVCYNGLDSYIETLRGAITEPHSEYQAIGIKDGDSYLQLSDSLLQIENEFYSSIRPKRVTEPGEIPLGALKKRGVEYIEVRLLDVNPFLPLGIDAPTMQFLDSLLLFCLLDDSPLCDRREHAEIQSNHALVVNEGRRPGLELSRNGSPISLQAWAMELIEQIEPVARLLDQAAGGSEHGDAVAAQRVKISDPEQTPSAQILAGLERSQCCFSGLISQLSEQHRELMLQNPLSAEQQATYSNYRSESFTKQRQIEDSDSLSFEQYLSNFYAQYREL